MVSVNTATFNKRETCPAAELLLLYHDAVLAPALADRITTHLRTCDFCHAELSLLTKHHPADDPVSSPFAMPMPLRRLGVKGLIKIPVIIVSFAISRLLVTDRMSVKLPRSFYCLEAIAKKFFSEEEVDNIAGDLHEDFTHKATQEGPRRAKWWLYKNFLTSLYPLGVRLLITSAKRVFKKSFH